MCHQHINNRVATRALISLPLVLGIVINATARGQSDGTTPLALTAGAPAGSYALRSLEHINPFNGHLSFTVPLLTSGGHGAAHDCGSNFVLTRTTVGNRLP
jgi:hypothetical protein